jgi:chromosome segregation ATPase
MKVKIVMSERINAIVAKKKQLDDSVNDIEGKISELMRAKQSTVKQISVLDASMAQLSQSEKEIIQIEDESNALTKERDALEAEIERLPQVQRLYEVNSKLEHLTHRLVAAKGNKPE